MDYELPRALRDERGVVQSKGRAGAFLDKFRGLACLLRLTPMTTLPARCERCDHCFCLSEVRPCCYCGITWKGYLEQKERRKEMELRGDQWWKG